MIQRIKKSEYKSLSVDNLLVRESFLLPLATQGDGWLKVTKGLISIDPNGGGGGGGGVGDMLKSIYDTNDDGIVDNASNLQGNDGAYYQARANHTGTQSVTTITGLGGAATKNVGTLSTEVAAGNHTHTGVYEPADSAIQAHLIDTANPHNVTKAQVGLSSVPNVDATDASNISVGTLADARLSSNIVNIVTSTFNAANKLAQLDNNAKLPMTLIPDGVAGGLTYQGLWNATTNSPTIPSAALANKGYYYKVGTAGSTTVDGISSWAVGDWIVSNGTAWDKIAQTDTITSVFGRTGVVVAANGDYSFSQISGTISTGQLPTGIAATNIGAGAVTNTEFGYLAGVTSAIQTQLNNKSATGHTHAATDIVSGTLADARLSSNVTLNASVQTLTNKTISGASNTITGLAASAISSGVLAPARLGSGTTDGSKFLRDDGSWQNVPASGDVTSNTAISVDNELALFSLTTGKVIKRATGTGIVSATSGVVSFISAPTGTLVGTSDTQTLTNKTISGLSNTLSNIGNSALVNSTMTIGATSVALGDTITALSGFTSISASNATLTNITATNATITNPTFSHFYTSGSYDISIPGTTSDTMVLAAATQTLTNKTISGSSNTITNLNASNLSSGTVATARLGSGTASASTVLYGDGTWKNPNATSGVFADNVFQITGSADASKIAVFEVDGLTTATTRTITIPDASLTLVGTATTQTLSNKTLDNTSVATIKGSNFTLQDATDTTKQAKFAMSGITTATTRTFTLPDATTTLVGTDATQTLTNKTLTAPIISTISNTGTLTLPTATDTLVGRATTDTLTNKTLGTGTAITLSSDATGDLYYRNSGGVLARLGIGSAGQVLTVSSGLPAWQTAPSGLPTQTGNSGKYLTTDGTNASWATVSSGGNTYTGTIGHSLTVAAGSSYPVFIRPDGKLASYYTAGAAKDIGSVASGLNSFSSGYISVNPINYTSNYYLYVKPTSTGALEAVAVTTSSNGTTVTKSNVLTLDSGTTNSFSFICYYADNEVCVIWQSVSGTLKACKVTLNTGTNTITAANTTTITSALSATYRSTKTWGAVARHFNSTDYLICYMKSDNKVYAKTYGRTSGTLGTETQISTSTETTNSFIVNGSGSTMHLIYPDSSAGVRVATYNGNGSTVSFGSSTNYTGNILSTATSTIYNWIEDPENLTASIIVFQMTNPPSDGFIAADIYKTFFFNSNNFIDTQFYALDGKLLSIGNGYLTSDHSLYTFSSSYKNGYYCDFYAANGSNFFSAALYNKKTISTPKFFFLPPNADLYSVVPINLGSGTYEMMNTVLYYDSTNNKFATNVLFSSKTLVGFVGAGTYAANDSVTVSLLGSMVTHSDTGATIGDTIYINNALTYQNGNNATASIPVGTKISANTFYFDRKF